MKQIKFRQKGKFLIINIPSKIYSKEAIINCLYWKLDSHKVFISEISGKEFQVSIDLKEIPLDQIDDLKSSLSDDLLDFELREIVNRETKNVRELIIAKAFANGALDDLV